MDLPDSELRLRILIALKRILISGESEEEPNKLVEILNSLGGANKLMEMQFDKNEAIYNTAVEIMKNHYELTETVNE